MEHFISTIDWTLVLESVKEIASALLMVLGGLAIIARYTKWAFDDKFFSIAEQAVKIIFMSIPTLLAIASYFKKKDKGNGK